MHHGLFPLLRGASSLCDLARQALQLLAIEHGIVDHAEHQLFGRAAAEAVDNALYCPHRDVSSAMRSTVRMVESFIGREAASPSRQASEVHGPFAQM